MADLDLDDDRDDHGAAAVVVADPFADDPAGELAQGVGVCDAVASRPLKGLLELGYDRGGERRVVYARAACVDLRAADDLAGARVEDHDHRDEALLAEDAPVLEL